VRGATVGCGEQSVMAKVLRQGAAAGLSPSMDDRCAPRVMQRLLGGLFLAPVRPPSGARDLWTVVDRFTRGGERYLVVRQNRAAPGGLRALTGRELQVVGGVAQGKSNKEIAYELGISYATARVLLARAYARLGVRSRKELLALPAIQALRRAERA
jgi:DNA-binding CsgD family transcriptional regulator